MQKIVFDSAQMPGDDRLRKEVWIDTLASAVARLNIDPSPGIHFQGRLEIVPVQDGSVSSVAATFRNATRSTRDIGIDGRDTVLFMFNAGDEMCRLSQRGREIDCAPGEAVLYDLAEPSNASTAPPAMSRVISIQLPRSLLQSRLAHYEDRLLVRVPAQNAALALARSYAEAILAYAGADHPHLFQLATTHLADLVAAAIKPSSQDLAALAPGFRGARLQAVLSQIARLFTDVTFSTRDVAAIQGISVRYVNDILQESGTSFSDRVLELRLQHAHAMLSDRRNDGMRIGDIAYASGFSDISHFNRSFRRRFGLTPTAAR